MSEAAVLGPIGPLADHAEQYGELGLPVFPVNPSDKTPLVSQHLATTDATTIYTWWRRWPDALIGHRVAPGQVLLDVDPRHGGNETWRAIKAEVGDAWPATRAHASGRGDGGGHSWWTKPDAKLSIRGLTEWARERGLGHAVVLEDGTATNRWACGIDLLHHDHRYTILPPSPHPETGAPYRWAEGRGPHHPVVDLPELLIELLTVAPTPPPAPAPPRLDAGGDSVADWYSASHSFRDLLGRHGWTLVRGDGDEDGSQWRHPMATSPVSATTKHGCLFVYSPNTPFEPTEQGDVHGYTRFAAYTLLDHHGDGSAAARAAREERDGAWVAPRAGIVLGAPTVTQAATEEPTVALGPIPIDWAEFWGREHIGEDWLVHPILPRGRQVALWARHKTGKSLLTLEVAAALATGRPCLSQGGGEPVDVIYLDMEMTEDDLHERLTDLGYGPEDDLSRLHYYLLPSLPPLDKAEGGHAVVGLAIRHQAKALVIDTMARVVAGDENEADTYRAFYRHTGLELKALGVSVLRLDHGGKDPTKGQRGSSGKGDDVDVVWQLRAVDAGLELVRDVSRMSWVPDKVALLRATEPHLRHTVISGGLWPAGTAQVASEMQGLGITSQMTQREALDLYRASGREGKTDVLRAAWRYLRELADREAAEWADEERPTLRRVVKPGQDDQEVEF